MFQLTYASTGNTYTITSNMLEGLLAMWMEIGSDDLTIKRVKKQPNNNE